MLKLYGFTYQCVEKKIEVAWKIENLKIFKILCWENDRDLDHVPDLCGAVKSSDFFHHFSCSFSSGVRSICLIFPSEFTPFFFFLIRNYYSTSWQLFNVLFLCWAHHQSSLSASKDLLFTLMKGEKCISSLYKPTQKT